MSLPQAEMGAHGLPTQLLRELNRQQYSRNEDRDPGRTKLGSGLEQICACKSRRASWKAGS